MCRAFDFIGADHGLARLLLLLAALLVDNSGNSIRRPVSFDMEATDLRRNGTMLAAPH